MWKIVLALLIITSIICFLIMFDFNGNNDSEVPISISIQDRFLSVSRDLEDRMAAAVSDLRSATLRLRELEN